VKVLKPKAFTGARFHRLLKPLLGRRCVLTRANRAKRKCRTWEYGCRVANALAGFDVGQGGAIPDAPCVAHERHGRHRCHAATRPDWSTAAPGAGQGARRREHLLFDVPVVGAPTIPVRESGATVLAVEAPALCCSTVRNARSRQRRRYRHRRHRKREGKLASENNRAS